MVSVVVEKTPFFAVWQGRKKVSSMSQNPFQGHPERMNECVFCVLHGRWKSSEQGGRTRFLMLSRAKTPKKSGFYQGFAALECLFSWCYMIRICWTEVCKLLRISLLDECPLWTSVSVSVVSVVFWGVPISLPIYIYYWLLVSYKS